MDIRVGDIEVSNSANITIDIEISSLFTSNTRKLNSVRIEDNRFGSILFFSFSFYFLLFFYWRVEDKEDKVWHGYRSHMLTWYKGTM